jgi:regulatory protein
VTESSTEAAVTAAVALLASRDRTRHEVEAALARQGVSAPVRAAAAESLTRAGYLDDVRFATGRAEALAARGSSDASVVADLEGRGVDRETISEALASLEPEARRAERVAAERGTTARTLRLLAARGFTEESLEQLVAACEEGAVG